MMDLSHLDDLIAHQDRGAALVIKHPTTGEPMPDLTLIIAGPDSETARRARLQMQDELYAYRGNPPAEDYDRRDMERLARCVVGWSMKRDGTDIPFSFSGVVRLFRGMAFIRDQAATFAASRVAYFIRTPLSDETN